MYIRAFSMVWGKLLKGVDNRKTDENNPFWFLVFFLVGLNKPPVVLKKTLILKKTPVGLKIKG